ncbi:MAG: DnaD domain protein [Clostridia bacterium]|nr:DnaD domain protein [Clostridia bacterium]
MAFIQNATTFDLGELNIENIFISDFMPSASGTYVKVYLLGLMFSRSENDAFRFDNKSLANMLGLPLQDVVEAWNYWEKQGIIKKHIHDDALNFDVEFLSLRELYILNNYTSKSEPTDRKSDPKIKSHYKTLCEQVEKIVGHPLSYTEYRDIGDFYDHYYTDTPIILRAFEINYKEKNIRSVKAVKGLLNQWLSQNLSTLESIEHHIKSKDERNMIYKEVLRNLGLSFRMANQAEKELIDKWLDQYEFEPESLYQFIIVFSKKTLNINMNYLDKVFGDLHKQGIKTVDNYESTQANDKPKAQTQSQAKRNRFTIEKERSYSEEELENLLLNKKN